MTSVRGEVLFISRPTIKGGMPVKNYDAPIKSQVSKDSTDSNEDESNSVSRLRNVFQTGNELKDNEQSQNRRYSAERKFKYASGSESSVDSRPTIPSKPKVSNSVSGIVDPSKMDPQKYFESTNHVQRFHLTRAIFTKMAEDNKKHTDREISTSPHRNRAISPTSSYPDKARVSSPTSPTRSSLSTDWRGGTRSISPQTQATIKLGSNVNSKPRSVSADQDNSKRDSYNTDISNKSKEFTPENYDSISESENVSKRNSHVESDIPSSYSSRADLHKNDSSQTNDKFKQSADQSNISQTYNDKEGSKNVSYKTNKFIKNDKNLFERATSDEVPTKPRLQNNFFNNSESSKLNSQQGVLLPKRRSGEEKRLPSKEDIAASLSEADSYWKRTYGTDLPETTDSTNMTESNCSSGSGEEMAKSDSNFQLSTTESPLSPASISPNWASQFPSDIPSSIDEKSLRNEENIPVTNIDNIIDDNSITEEVFLLNDVRKDHNSPSISIDDSEKSKNNSYDFIVSDDTHSKRLSGEFEARMDESLESNLNNSDSLSCSSSEASQKRNSVLDMFDSDNTATSFEPPPPYLETSANENFENSNQKDIRSDDDDKTYVNIEEMKLDSNSFENDSLQLEKNYYDESIYENAEVSEKVMASDVELVSGQYNESIVPTERVAGDGREEILDAVDNVDNVYSEGELSNEDSNLYYEIEGIPASDPDHHLFPTAKIPSIVRFSHEPVRVYATWAVEEYDRKNEDVDPMAASAEYELEKRIERMTLFPVDLVKGKDGLGLSIIGMGVGADAGLEKLGIFIKTLTEGGTAERDARIQVNDQIIEVDGKSLVGVTQAYAASVLRNTYGTVHFIIGREENSQNSEVARLIQQSIAQDKHRADMQKLQMEREQSELENRTRQMYQQELEMEQADFLDDGELPSHPMDSPPPLPEEAYMHGDTHDSSDDMEDENNAPIEVFDLPEDADNDILTPDTMFLKLKETQYKNAVAEAELAKLRARMILLENCETQKKHAEKKCEDLSLKLKETEHNLHGSQKDLSSYQDMLEQSQSEYINLEKQLREELISVEKKYLKTKKHLKDTQTREKDLETERDALLQQQQNKDEQYNTLVKSYKDRIIDLEKELADALRAAGLPWSEQEKRDLPEIAPLSQSTENLFVVKSLKEKSEIDSDCDSDTSPDKDFADSCYEVTSSTELTKQDICDIDIIPKTQLLDVSPHREKIQLTTSAIAKRRKPTKNSFIALPNEENEEIITKTQRKDDDSHSDTSSISQTSYDPSHPIFSQMESEIPYSSSADLGSVTLISSHSKNDIKPPSSASSSSSASPDSSSLGCVKLISKTTIGGSLDSGGVALLSSRSLDNSYNSFSADSSSLSTSHVSSSGHVGEYDTGAKSASYDFISSKLTVESENESMRSADKYSYNQYQTKPVNEWSVQQVSDWLLAIHMGQYSQEFYQNNIDGAQLLLLDSSTKLKTLGILSKDKTILKKRIKDLRVAVEHEKKMQEKNQKAREKLEKQATSQIKKKKFPFVK